MTLIINKQELVKKINKSKNIKNSELLANQIKYDFGKCKICSDEATGIHYGSATCEGCKGFFKRSILRHKKYSCKSDLNCKIEPKQRKKCKYCRWMRCLKEVKTLIEEKANKIEDYNRIYFLSIKYLIKLNNLKNFDSMEIRDLLANNIFIERYLNTSNENQLYILTILRDKSYQIYIENTIEYQSQYKQALLNIENNQKLSYDKNQEYIKYLRKTDMETLKKHAQKILIFLNDLPGFSHLCDKDKYLIIQDSFFITFGLLTLKLFINNEFYLITNENIQLNKEILYELIGVQYTENIFEFSSKLNELNLTDYEISLILPFFLTHNYYKLAQPETYKKLNELYCRSLFYEFSLKQRSEEFLNNFVQTISIAPKMEKICRDIEFKSDSDINTVHI